MFTQYTANITHYKSSLLAPAIVIVYSELNQKCTKLRCSVVQNFNH